ncbi:MAG: GYD domain-containing protein [Gemmatimonadales bacterium]
MAKYLLQGSYTPQGVQGLRKDGGTGRRAAVKRLVEQVGGKLESFYFAFGESDVHSIVELPDTATALALSLAVNAIGVVNLRTVPLITPEEMDAATKKSIDYQPPGSASR